MRAGDGAIWGRITETGMTTSDFDSLLSDLRARFAALAAENERLNVSIHELTEVLKASQRPVPESEMAAALRDCIAGKKGATERARWLLGDFSWLTCEGCRWPFRSGGKRRKRCGNCTGAHK